MEQDRKTVYSDGDIESTILNTIDNPIEFQKLFEKDERRCC